jgi:hypothetical protein
VTEHSPATTAELDQARAAIAEVIAVAPPLFADPAARAAIQCALIDVWTALVENPDDRCAVLAHIQVWLELTSA